MSAMRFLFSFTGGTGHFVPTAVFAKALARRGHEVLFGCQEGMVATVAAAGWLAEPTGGASLMHDSARRPLVPVDRDAEERVMRDFFAGKAAQERAGRLNALIGSWRPDMVVRDEVDFGAAIAAEAAGLPHAAVVVIAAGRLTRPEVTEEALAAVRSELGLGPERANDALHRYLLLVPVPPSFRDPRWPLPGTARYVRPGVLEDVQPATNHARPGPGAGPPPRVYLTLGTIFPQESGDLFHRALAGLSTLPVEVTVTTGAIAPAELGPQPARVHLQQFLPLAGTLARSDLVVSHGGSGTVVSSLALGLPQVILAMGADQPDNADRCRHLGVGLDLDPFTASPSDIAGAVAAVLHAPQYRTAAQRIADDARSLPGADHAASLLEAVARTASPITDLGPQATA
ncbi:MAG TPA: glycosyltransferase [Acidimicrobiales bacterium]|nr:glycosyltransferase [Acidimicrobiales bacterium]